MAETPRTVAVIGAGPAGITAAWRLARAGCAVTVLERSERAGGRAGSSAPHLLSAADRRLLALLQDAGLAGEFLPLRPWYRARFAGDGDLVPAAGIGPLAAWRLPGVSWIEALRLVRLNRLGHRYADCLDPEAPERAAPLDDRCLRDFGELYFGPGVVRHCFEPLLGEAAPANAAHVSRVAFLLRWQSRRGVAVGALRSDSGAPWRRLAESLETRFDHAVEAIDVAGERMQVRWQAGDAPGSGEFDAVVLALPARETVRLGGALLVDAERRDLAEAPMDPAIRWQAEVGSVRAAVRTWVVPPPGQPLASLTLEPGMGATPARISALARPGWSLERLAVPDDTVVKEFAAAVERYGLRATGTSLERHPQAFPRFDVGRYRSLARLRRVQQDRRRAGRRLYLAGDHWIAPSIEGAVVSGERAAAEALEDLRVSRSHS